MKLAAIVSLCLSLLVPAAASAADPKPRTGKTVVVKRVKGTVFVQKRGSSKRTRLGAARAVPVGSVIDATRGTVRLTSTANRRGTRRQSAVFYDGAFRVTQRRAARPMTDLTLVGGDFSGCSAAARAGSDVFASRHRGRRRLWGRGRGRFRTRGRNGTATVRGTTWRTEDSCAGTETFNRSGKVLTNAAGADLERLLDPGQSVIYRCNTSGIPGISSLYCLVVLSQPADNIYGFGIATGGTPQNDYDLCIRRPDGSRKCETYPFDTSDPTLKAGGVGCYPPNPGPHVASWRLGGVELPESLPFEAVGGPLALCVSSPERWGDDPDNPPPGPVGKEKLRQVHAAARHGS